MAKVKTPEDASEDEIIKDVCLANGLAHAHLAEEGPTCTLLEMFFSGYPRIVGLQHFPNLEVLVIIGQNITKIEGLDQVPRLRELWIAEGRLKKIEGLEKLTGLQKLCLYENQIEKISNLDQLISLEILWLNNNRISTIQELSSLKSLKVLNLAENRIEKIGNSLNALTTLERLELSGNRINSFRDLTNLVKLPRLTHLGLKMPCYHASPVGLLCNYSTYILYHLPSLEYLDGSEIMCKTLKQLAETTVRKKKMFYNMKMKTLYRNLTEVKARLLVTKQEILKVPYERIRNLFHVLKEIDLELHFLKSEEDLEKHESETESDKDARETKAEEERSAVELYKSKQRAIRDKIKRWEHKCSEIAYYHQESLERMKQTAEGTVHRLLTELETGGNVRFEDGLPSCLWFSSCHDLVLSRFCAADYKDYGILGIKIHRITRVHNRMLRSRFDDAFSSHVDDEDSPFFVPKNPGYKNLLEYLFWIWDPEVPGGQTDVARILEDGFPDANMYKQLGKEAAVPLTNSLSLADRLRMLHLIKQNHDKEFPEACPFRFGQLVVCKVFIGNCNTCVDNKPINQSQYPTADSVFRPKKDKTPKPPEGSTTGSVHSVMSTKSPCECGSRQSEWFIFNHELVVPEYIIDFEYITRHQPRSPFVTHHHEMTLLERKHRPLCLVEEFPNDEDVLELRPAIKPRSRLIGLSESVMLKISKARAITNIQYLNLHGNGLTKVKEVQALPRLKRLVLSFNELTRLDELAHMNLEYIDASFNQLVTLDGLKSMNSLLYLDVSWNSLSNTRDEMAVLRKYMPVLSVLDIRHNYWQKPEGLRLRIIGRLKTLTKLDGVLVGDEETAAALRMAAGSRISQVSLLMHSRTDTEPLRTLSLQTHAHTLAMYSNKKPDRAVDLDNNWYLKLKNCMMKQSKEGSTELLAPLTGEIAVTTLNLDGQHISKLSNLERLENLQWASFNNNDLTKIEGLDNCQKLEELSLESNCITRIEGLTRLEQLRHLNLSHNYIDCLEHTGFDRLPQLHYLDLEDNRITSLAGLQRALSLTELYISNNLVESVREIFYLKANANLVIIDIFGNPAASSVDNYRLFVIYHLKMLKALDGKSVEGTEVSQAKDMFGGRLTQDFVAEKLCVSDFNKLMELDFPNMNIRSIDLGHGDTFLNLRSVNLEHNNLVSFGGLIYLLNLKVLCLNHNHIDCIMPRARQQNAGLPRGRVAGSPLDVIPPDSCTQLLEKLEVLHLGYNGIKDVAALQLFRLPSLKALFLQGNEIVKIEGLDALHELRELVLDRNRIKNIGEMSFTSQWQLQELHLEENRLRELTNITVLNSLKRLFLGMNRIQDFGELDKLESMTTLVELSLVSNAVARRMLHRPLLIYRMQNLRVIDGIPVMDEERAKAEMYFNDLQPPASTTTVEATLPGLGAYKTHVSMKVTNMQLVSYTADKMWSGSSCLTEEATALQNQQDRGGGRRRGYGRTEPLQGIQPITGKPPGSYAVPQLGHNKASPQQMTQVNYLPQYQHNNDTDNRFQKNAKR